MRAYLFLLLASLSSGSMIMILHELPKAFLYNFALKKQKDNEDTKLTENIGAEQKIWRLHHYIDPIGLLFCVVLRIGFSKPYYYKIRDRKFSRLLGISGLLSLIIQIIVSTSILRYGMGVSSKLIIPISTSNAREFFIYFLTSYAIISIGMLITNLFPIVAFDMGLLIAASSPLKFYSIIRADYLIKMVWLFTVLLGIMTSVSAAIFQIFMG